MLNEIAHAWRAAGFCTIPIRGDGTKSPALPDWKIYQERLPNDTEMTNWFGRSERQGFGIVCGQVSGGLEMFEFEGAALREGHRDRFLALLADNGQLPLWTHIQNGYAELTPSGGLHYLYRVSDGPALGNVKLASRLATPEELAANPKAQVRVLIETRGEGGQTVMAPSHGDTHPTKGAWVNFYGKPGRVPTITAAERDAIHAVARMLDEIPARPQPVTRGPRPDGADETPMERFNRSVEWADIIEPHGWQYVCTRGDTTYWLRPGKDAHDLRGSHSWSASTGHNAEELGADVMYVFSSSTNLDHERAMSKAYVKALLDHNGDMSAMLTEWLGNLALTLGAREVERLTEVLAAPFPAAPTRVRARAMTKAASPYFHKDPRDMAHQFQLLTLCEDLELATPMIRTAEGVAIYRDGVYRTDRTQLAQLCSTLLGNLTSGHYVREAEQMLLVRLGDPVPPPTEPLLNLRNGMLDLRTLQLLPHDPAHRSIVQLDVAWDPDATCPVYDAWVASAAGDQVDQLEEVTSLMLDPSRVPHKAVFLFGPSRSGKSTYLRLMVAVAGAANTSSVTLHQLADDRFAVANLHGKMLNVAADLSSQDVKDIAAFKMLSGEDQVNANRKYGAQFSFTNRALFAFSANSVPAVSDESGAYFQRMMPFEFANSFAGREDHSLEEKLKAELPGILVRWATAGNRLRRRGGGFERTSASVREGFEAQSDRVRRFIQEACNVMPEMSGGTKTTDLHRAFVRWAADQSAPALGRNSFATRLAACPGVHPLVWGDRTIGWKVTVKPAEEW